MLNEINLSRTDLNLLVIFEAVYTEGHVGRAAKRLNLTASAVSHGLGRLRQLLNDPLFLKTPKGVVPTARAVELSSAIADVLARARNVISSAAPFDPATSTRRFIIAAPDAVSAVILPGLMNQLQQSARGVHISVRQLLAVQGQSTREHPWHSAFADLDARSIDIAIIPSDDIPARYFKSHLYDEEFVVVVRAGHAFANAPTLAHYCEFQHLVVSATGDPYGFVDRALAQQGLTRRTVLTVPNFMFALAVLAQSDLICAVPRRFAERHAALFGVSILNAPLPLERFRLNAVAPKPAMMDAGLSWLVDRLQEKGQNVGVDVMATSPD